MTHRPLVSSQKELFTQLKKMDLNGHNTHEVATYRGDYQTYESWLRDRLFRLVDHGLLRAVEDGPIGGPCRARRWFFWEDSEQYQALCHQEELGI